MRYLFKRYMVQEEQNGEAGAGGGGSADASGGAGDSSGGGDQSAASSGAGVADPDITDFDMASALKEVAGGIGLEKPNTDTTPAKTPEEMAAELKAEEDARALEVANAGKTPEQIAEEAAAAAALADSVDPDGASLKTPPKTWTKEELAAWNKVPESARAAILRREEDMFKGIEQYKAQAQFGTTVADVIQPYVPIMQQAGIDPIKNIQNLMHSHYTLATGTPEQKIAFIRSIISDYHIDWNGLTAPGPVAPPNPEVQALRNQVTQLTTEQSRIEQERQQATYASNMAEVTAFKADPANIYFEEVRPQMAELFNKGMVTSLKDAYDKAVQLNPITRQKELDRLFTERQTKQAKEASDRAAAAKKALAANLKSAPKGSSATGSRLNLDETLEATYDRLQSNG